MCTYFMNETTKTLKLFFIIHIVISVLAGVIALCVFDGEAFRNFIIGELLMSFSLLSMGFALYLGFFKKNIALLVGVIVFKWPILIYVVFKLIGNNQAYLGYLAAGFSIWIFSALIWSIFNQRVRL